METEHEEEFEQKIDNATKLLRGRFDRVAELVDEYLLSCALEFDLSNGCGGEGKDLLENVMEVINPGHSKAEEPLWEIEGEATTDAIVARSNAGFLIGMILGLRIAGAGADRMDQFAKVYSHNHGNVMPVIMKEDLS